VQLDLHDNRIIDTSGLNKLLNLRTLNLANNLIEVVDFPEMKNLVDLNLKSNKIKVIKKLIGFASLAKLNLANNKMETQ